MNVKERLQFLKRNIQKEVKKLEEDCEKAIQQIDHRMYAKKFEDSYDEVIC